MNIQMSPDGWQMLGLGLLALFLLAAVRSDWRHRKVPNRLVLMALVCGVVLHAIGPQMWMRSGGLFTLAPSALGPQGPLLGAVLALAIFLPFYGLGLLGAGDVKLLAAVGSFSGAGAFINLAVFILLAGGLLALARMAMARNARLVMENTLATLGQMLPGSVGTFDARTRTAWRMPYAVAIAAGVFSYACWTLNGLTPLLNF